MIGGTKTVASAHRVTWTNSNGPIPDGLTINHKNGIKETTIAWRIWSWLRSLGAASPRDRGSECQSPSAKGKQASEDKDHRSRRFADAPDARQGRDGENHRRSLRDETKSSFGDLHREDLASRLTWPLPNCWKGVSVEDQRRADERIPLLLDTPAALHWISAEPLLGPIKLRCCGTSTVLGEQISRLVVAAARAAPGRDFQHRLGAVDHRAMQGGWCAVLF